MIRIRFGRALPSAFRKPTALLTAVLATASAALLLTTACATSPAGTAPAAAPSDLPYFQQGIEYRIEARLDESTDVLTARARVRYENRSPWRLDTLYFHQHLNAFRPNSRWARYDLASGRRDFQDLGPDEHAFERISSVSVDGAAIQPIHPLSPDSTVVAIPLPRSLRPGESAMLEIDWTARLSTLPRRQGREGRHYDWAQWYPRIAVLDRGGWQVNPLIRPGEFYGEFATYDVTLDLAADQVVAATGVPVGGDPGWEGAAAAPEWRPRSLARDAYGALEEEPLGLLTVTPGPGRKRVRFHARDVHHFAWSTNPEYIYEGGEWRGTPVHVLYRPGDEESWGDGQVLESTYDALDWMAEVFAPYPWPQFTNLHRIEGGGTEFPMLIMDGSASPALIVHETAHQYAHGILANNEWREAWLDEGMASFLTDWWSVSQGGGDPWTRARAQIAQMEQAGMIEPLSLHAAEYSSYQAYSAMSYGKGSLFVRTLMERIGEPAFRRGMKLYYERNQFRHVRPEDLREAMEAASGEDLADFFHRWLETTEPVVTGGGAGPGTRAR